MIALGVGALGLRVWGCISHELQLAKLPDAPSRHRKDQDHHFLNLRLCGEQLLGLLALEGVFWHPDTWN